MLHIDPTSFLRAFLALFIITDILGNLPIFIGLTEDQSKEERRKTFSLAILTGFIILLVFTFAGTWILALYHITLSDFKIAGGIMLLAIAINLLLREHHPIHHDEVIGAVPLGSPLITGPGAITTVIVLIGEYGLAVSLAAVVACFGVNWAILVFSERFYDALGKRGARIIGKISSILIAAIAVQFMRDGIMGLF